MIAAFDTVTKGLLKGLEDLEIRTRVETIQTTLLKTARILRRVMAAQNSAIRTNHIKARIDKTQQNS